MKKSSRHINICTKCISSEKKSLDLLAMSMLIKQDHVDSVLRDATVSHIARVASCSRKKAAQIRKDMIMSDLFRYDVRTNRFTCNKLNEKYIEYGVSSKGHNMESVNVYAYNVGKCTSLKEMKVFLQSVLIMNAVNAKIRVDELKKRMARKCSSYPKESSAISSDKMKNIVGASKATMYRRASKLIESGIIARDTKRCKVVQNTSSDITYLDKNMFYCKELGSVMKRECSDYSFKNGEEQRNFKHIILNHAKRVNSRTTKFDRNNIMESELMGAYN